MSISAKQAAAARLSLGIKRDDLAAAAKVSPRTITDFERGAREPIHATRAALRAALEARGAEFLPDGGLRISGAALAAAGAAEGDGAVTE